MDILIKNWKMPSCCYGCFCAYDMGMGNYACPFSQGGYAPIDTRRDDCPLVELPPHGRLIDATELEASDAIIVGEDAWNMVHNAPTVLEAST